MNPYRYTLTRCLCLPVPRDSVRTLCWVMLNPSTADETVDDPTIRRVKRFTYDNGYTDLIVVNLFAARATNPNDLLDMAGAGVDPIGANNSYWLAWAFAKSDAVVFAWGAWLDKRPLKRLHPHALVTDPLCLGTTASGAPRHPLYVRADQPLVPYPQ